MSATSKLTLFFRTKSNEDKVYKVLKYTAKAANEYNHSFDIYYDSKSKFWWVRTQRDMYRDYFPCGWWVRADEYFLSCYKGLEDDDDLKKMLAEYGLKDIEE